MTDYAIVAGGIKQQARGKYHIAMPEFNGRHLWIFMGMWRVENPAAEHHNFDLENLLTVEGPGCFWCEQPWSVTLGSKCPGEPS